MKEPQLDPLKPAKTPGFLGMTWPRFREVLVNSASNFNGYRELTLIPLKTVFAYLIILVVAVTVLLSARDIYRAFRHLSEIAVLLRGNIPPVTLEEGKASCPRESFEFRRDDPYLAQAYRDRLELFSRGSSETLSRARQAQEKGKEISLEALEELSQKNQQYSVVAAWAAQAFPDPQESLNREKVWARILIAQEKGELSDQEAEQGRILAEEGFIFRVELDRENPEFRSPFIEGVFFTRQKSIFQIPYWPEPLSLDYLFSPEEELSIDSDSLPRLVKSLVLSKLAPLFVIWRLFSYGIVRLAQTLLGALVVMSVSGFCNCRFKFKKAYAIGVFSLTVPVLLGLLLELFGVVFPGQVYIVVGIYLLYCVMAALRCART